MQPSARLHLNPSERSLFILPSESLILVVSLHGNKSQFFTEQEGNVPLFVSDCTDRWCKWSGALYTPLAGYLLCRLKQLQHNFKAYKVDFFSKVNGNSCSSNCHPLPNDVSNIGLCVERWATSPCGLACFNMSHEMFVYFCNFGLTDGSRPCVRAPCTLKYVFVTSNRMLSKWNGAWRYPTADASSSLGTLRGKFEGSRCNCGSSVHYRCIRSVGGRRATSEVQRALRCTSRTSRKEWLHTMQDEGHPAFESDMWISAAPIALHLPTQLSL